MEQPFSSTRTRSIEAGGMIVTSAWFAPSLRLGRHHHALGSESGKIHNDLNPAFFADNPNADGVNVNDPRLCSYQFGDVHACG